MPKGRPKFSPQPECTIGTIASTRTAVRSDDWRQNEERQKESGNDQPRQTEVVNQFLDFRLLPNIYCTIFYFFHAVSPLI